MLALVTSKTIVMLIIFFEVIFFGNLVSKLSCFKNTYIMGLSLTFSGSLFLSIALLDILPQAAAHFDKFLQPQWLQDTSPSLMHGKFPLTVLIAVVTLLAILFIDKVLIGHKHDHQHLQFQNQAEISNNNQENNQDNPQPNAQVNIVAGTQTNTVNNVQRSLTQQLSWKPFMLQAGMSIHSFFQSLALGLQQTNVRLFSLAIAIIVHKWAEGLTLGLYYKKDKYSNKIIFLMIFIQAIVNVVGMLIGSFLSGQGDLIMAIFMSMAAGTFLYISLIELLQQQFKKFNKIKMVLTVVANFFIIFIARLEEFQNSQNK